VIAELRSKQFPPHQNGNAAGSRPSGLLLGGRLGRSCGRRIPRWGGPHSEWRDVLGPCAMPSSADECWRLSGDCGRWAAESGDDATRAAFRQMAKVWAQLAFSLNFTPPPRNEPVEGSEASKNPPSENPPILTEPEHRTSDSDAEKDSRHRTPQQQRLSLPSRTPFPER